MFGGGGLRSLGLDEGNEFAQDTEFQLQLDTVDHWFEGGL